MIARPLSVLACVGALVGLPLAQSQAPQPVATTPTPRSDFGTINVQSNLGSFRLIDGEGRVEVSFKGTILISRLVGEAIPTGNIKLEHETPDKQRRLYSGQGTFVISGKWRAVQWFGSDMRLRWNGKGIIRITGEFDRNLETGRYWYDEPDKWQPLPSTSMITLTVPQQRLTPNVTPRERPSGG